MFLAYVDDSGDDRVFVLSAVIVRDADWLPLLDAWSSYRRWLRDEFGLAIVRGRPTRRAVELHATDIVTGAGAWHKLRLGRAARIRAYKQGIRLIARYASVFAVAWDPSRAMSDWYKDNLYESPATDCWTVLLERLATFSTYSGGERVMTLVDSGYEAKFRRVYRRMRRYHRVGSLRGGSLPAAAPMFVDDPVTRDSRESPFVQMADLCAYAAFRELRPRSDVPSLWSELGDSVVRDVNRYMVKEPPGIKLLPTT